MACLVCFRLPRPAYLIFALSCLFPFGRPAFCLACCLVFVFLVYFCLPGPAYFCLPRPASCRLWGGLHRNGLHPVFQRIFYPRTACRAGYFRNFILRERGRRDCRCCVGAVPVPVLRLRVLRLPLPAGVAIAGVATAGAAIACAMPVLRLRVLRLPMPAGVAIAGAATTGASRRDRIAVRRAVSPL